MKRIITIIVLLSSLNTIAQQRFSYDNMRTILSFHDYLCLKKDSIEIKDTTQFMKTILSYFSEIGYNNEISDYINAFYMPDKRFIQYTDTTNSAIYSSGTKIEGYKIYKKYFAVLFYTENMIVRNSNVDNAVKRISYKYFGNKHIIDGTEELTKKEAKHVKKIFNYYLKWFESDKEYKRKAKLPLALSRYKWE